MTLYRIFTIIRTRFSIYHIFGVSFWRIVCETGTIILLMISSMLACICYCAAIVFMRRGIGRARTKCWYLRFAGDFLYLCTAIVLLDDCCDHAIDHIVLLLKRIERWSDL